MPTEDAETQEYDYRASELASLGWMNIGVGSIFALVPLVGPSLLIGKDALGPYLGVVCIIALFSSVGFAIIASGVAYIKAQQSEPPLPPPPFGFKIAEMKTSAK